MDGNRSDMTIVNMRGGLGNQMFCYALGRHLEIRTDNEIKYDYIPPYELQVDRFHTDLQMASEDDIKSVCGSSLCKPAIIKFGEQIQQVPYGSQILSKVFNIYQEKNTSKKSYQQKSNWPHHRQFHEPILDISDSAYLFGYWQSPNYFEDIRETIIEEFSVPSLNKANQEMLAQIRSVESVAIHIRRGDVADQGDADPLEYFVRASEYMAERIDMPHFFFFSDEPEFVRQELDLSYPSTLVDINSPSTAHLDMNLLQCCDHHINSSSTFSWWGAWLNKNDKKIVTVPKPFTRGEYSQTHMENWDFIPQDWHFIEY